MKPEYKAYAVAACNAIPALCDEIERLQAALAIYADPSNWLPDADVKDMWEGEHPGWWIAKQVLEAGDKQAAQAAGKETRCPAT